MLVLGFKPGEGAYVGRGFRVTVRAVRGNHVQLGFECDPTIAVSRDKFPLESHLEAQQNREHADASR